MKNIKIIIPSDCITGGPDAQHDLCSRLNFLNFNASVVYFPDINAKIPDTYLKYNGLKQDLNLDDSNENIIILPEVFCGLAKNFKKARVIIWWLSVDNYFSPNSSPKNLYRYFKDSLFGNKDFLHNIRKHDHIAQSHYASNYLKCNSISSTILFEPIASDFYKTSFINNSRNNSILYNPKKGFKFTEKLMKVMKNYNFIPLINYNSNQLLELYNESKIYLDFGSHPGRDRIPRETVLNGCCIIVSRFGSANNDYDIPIPNFYKFDLNYFENSCHNIIKLIDSILFNFEAHSEDFNNYRKIIIDDYNNYDKNLDSYFKKIT